MYVCLSVCMSTEARGYWMGPLELELEMVMSYHVVSRN